MNETVPEDSTQGLTPEYEPKCRSVSFRVWRIAGCFGALVAVSAIVAWCAGIYSPPAEIPVVKIPGMHSTVVVAMERARERLARKPRSSDAWGYYGMLLLQHDRPGEALTCFEEAIRFDRENPKWHYFVGVILEKTDLHKSLEFLKSALTLKGESIPILLRISTVAITLGEFELAAEALGVVREKVPKTSELWLQLVRLERLKGSPSNASRWLEMARESGMISSELLLESAVAEAQCGNVDRAKQLEAEAVHVSPLVPTNDPWMEELQKLDFSGNVSSSNADRLRTGGQIAEAARALEALARRFPERSRPALNLALALRDQGRIEDAVLAINSLVEQFPEDPLIRFHQAVLKSQFGSSTDEVTVALNEALRLKPDYGTARAGLADLLAIQGRYAEAMENFSQAILDSPGDPWIRLGFVSFLIKQGRKEEAEIQLQQLDLLLTPQEINEHQEVSMLRSQLSQLPALSPEKSISVP